MNFHSSRTNASLYPPAPASLPNYPVYSSQLRSLYQCQEYFVYGLGHTSVPLQGDRCHGLKRQELARYLRVRYACGKCSIVSTVDYSWAHLVKIHISSSKQGEETPELAARAKKLMHRFSAEEVRSKMDEVEEPSA